MIVDICVLEELYTNFIEKTSTKLAYLLETFVGALSIFNWAIWVFFEGYTLSLVSEQILKIAMYTMKASYSALKIATVNSSFLISLTLLVVRSMFSVVKDLHYKFRAWKLILALLMISKGILRTISGLTSTNWKFSSKNISLPLLSNMKKLETIIP